jgi:hypothetical protein
MTWAITKALAIGRDIELHVTSPEHVGENHTFTYGYPAFEGQTKAQFKQMVKREVNLLVRDLNATVPVEDITEEFGGVSSFTVKQSSSRPTQQKALRKGTKSSSRLAQ